MENVTEDGAVAGDAAGMVSPLAAAAAPAESAPAGSAWRGGRVPMAPRAGRSMARPRSTPRVPAAKDRCTRCGIPKPPAGFGERRDGRPLTRCEACRKAHAADASEAYHSKKAAAPEDRFGQVLAAFEAEVGFAYATWHLADARAVQIALGVNWQRELNERLYQAAATAGEPFAKDARSGHWRYLRADEVAAAARPPEAPVAEARVA